ncbi:MAG TPA: hypothetical protein DEP47_07365 [Chloroflexi bacterium]|nr:hypothetical protein [Chloroflexota bacterium]
MIGPLQLSVIGFDEDKYYRDIIVELKNLRKEKIIRLFDLLYLIKHPDGTIAAKEVDDLQASEQREFGTLIKSLLGLSAKDAQHINADEVAEAIGSEGDEFGMSESEIQALADQIPNGSSAIFVIFEHSWARGVKKAILDAGGYLRAQGLINPESLQTTTNELAIVLEAIEKAETASMEKMAGVMADAKAQEEEAQRHADEAVAEAQAIEATAMAALAAAALKEEEANQAVAEAEARVEAARQHAAEVAAEAEAMEDEAFAQAEAVRRAAERQKEKAEAEAAEALREAEEIEAAAVLRAMNAMVAARIIEKEAVREALNAVIAADVIEASAAQKAAKSLASG